MPDHHLNDDGTVREPQNLDPIDYNATRKRGMAHIRALMGWKPPTNHPEPDPK